MCNFPIQMGQPAKDTGITATNLRDGQDSKMGGPDGPMCKMHMVQDLDFVHKLGNQESKVALPSKAILET